MTNHILKILFVISKSRINKKGLVPITCRITYSNKRKPFATGLFTYPENWYSKHQKAKPFNEENDFINTQLSMIKQEINQAFLFLQVNETVFDVDDIYLQYKGESIKTHKSILEVFELHNTKMEKLIGKEYSISTFVKFKEAKMHISNFIKHSYKKNDILLENLTLKFLPDLDYYLKSEKDHKQITINKTIQRVRKILKLALAEGFLKTDPFILYKPKRVVKKIIFLSTEELEELKKHEFKQSRLNQVKDLFVFCCYTGLAYQEMTNLGPTHIKMGFDGNYWIEMYRQKTKSKVSVPLLPESKEILKKYNNVLPKISNQKFNSYLKEIADIIGINKRLTHHIARKTFATTVLLYNGVPMEIVSELLGHSKITITQQHYAKVVQKRVSDEVIKLSKKLNKK